MTHDGGSSDRVPRRFSVTCGSCAFSLARRHRKNLDVCATHAPKGRLGNADQIVYDGWQFGWGAKTNKETWVRPAVRCD